MNSRPRIESSFVLRRGVSVKRFSVRTNELNSSKIHLTWRLTMPRVKIHLVARPGIFPFQSSLPIRSGERNVFPRSSVREGSGEPAPMGKDVPFKGLEACSVDVETKIAVSHGQKERRVVRLNDVTRYDLLSI